MSGLALIRYACGGAILGYAVCDLLGRHAEIAANDLTMMQIIGALLGATVVLVVLVRR